MKKRVPPIVILLALVATVSACAKTVSLLDVANPRFAAVAPDSFDVEMVTTKGTVTVRVRRDWSPHGADRFYSMVREHFLEDVAFHRVIAGFVAQFGIHGDSAVARTWAEKERRIPDDSVRTSNRRGTLSFASAGPNTRSTQMFFNLENNAAGLDSYGGFGFPPIGQVTAGLEILDRLYAEYSTGRGGPAPEGPNQDSIQALGNAYLLRRFPQLDYIKSARVARKWD